MLGENFRENKKMFWKEVKRVKKGENVEQFNVKMEMERYSLRRMKCVRDGNGILTR